MSSFRINPQVDFPIEDAKLLGHDKIIDTLSKFLILDEMEGPLSIAIHGEWGSGKTSLMMTLMKKLTRHEKVKPIFFEAWKHEYSDPALALVETIISKSAKIKGKTVVKGIIKLAADIFARQNIGMTAKEIEAHFMTRGDAVDNMSDAFQKAVKQGIGKKKLIVFIDDLDRCSVENSLKILNIMKLFLDTKNCIFVAAVDFDRLEQAWALRYGNETKVLEEGRDYLEKIFQIRIGVTHPSERQIQEYVKMLVPNMPLDVITLFGKVSTANPRSIKKILNMISYRSFLVHSNGLIAAILWSILEESSSQESAVHLYKNMQESGGFVNLIMDKGGNWEEISQLINNQQSILAGVNANFQTLRIFFSESQTILINSKVSKTDLEENFANLYEASNEFLR